MSHRCENAATLDAAPTVAPIGGARLSYLDGLRGMAICGVLLTHVGQAIPNAPIAVDQFARFGFRGVQLFFIVSAFTMFSAYTGRIFVAKDFYIKRFFRIAPMFYLAVVLYMALRGIIIPGQEFDSTVLKNLLLTVFFVHGLSPSAINDIVPGGWSIACEALFYFIFPFLLAMLTTLKRALVAAFAGVVAAVVSRLALSVLLAEWVEAEALGRFIHFGFLTNLPAFLFGVVVYHLRASPLADLLRPFANLGLLSALLLLCVIGAFGFGVLRNTLLASAVLAALVFFATQASWPIIDNPILRYTGKISFSIYLLHFVVLHGLDNAVVSLAGEGWLVAMVTLYVLVMAITAALASLTYRFVEAPMIDFAKTLSRKQSTAPVSAVSSSGKR
ncbi:MAG: acyltransferase [Caulobacter sp.]